MLLYMAMLVWKQGFLRGAALPRPTPAQKSQRLPLPVLTTNTLSLLPRHPSWPPHLLKAGLPTVWAQVSSMTLDAVLFLPHGSPLEYVTMILSSGTQTVEGTLPPVCYKNLQRQKSARAAEMFGSENVSPGPPAAGRAGHPGSNPTSCPPVSWPESQPPEPQSPHVCDQDAAQTCRPPRRPESAGTMSARSGTSAAALSTVRSAQFLCHSRCLPDTPPHGGLPVAGQVLDLRPTERGARDSTTGFLGTFGCTVSSFCS